MKELFSFNFIFRQFFFGTLHPLPGKFSSGGSSLNSTLFHLQSTPFITNTVGTSS